MNDWFRSWHGAPTDPKWLGIARRVDLPAGIVAAVAWALMDRASQSSDRGSIAGYDAEALGAFFGCEPEQVEAIVSAMTDKGMVVDGRLAAWEKRQPKREDSSTKRVRRHRERNETQCNATKPDVTTDTDTDTDTDTEATDARARDAAVPENRYDQLETELREAAGLENDPSPSLFDLSPMVELLDKDYPLKLILAKLREWRAKKRKPPSSWRYFVPIITEAHLANQSIPKNPTGQPGKKTQWVTHDDPRWPALAEQYATQHGKPPNPVGSRHEAGTGWHFPAEWIETRAAA